MGRWVALTIACLSLGAVGIFAVPTATAKDGNDVRVAGTCTKASAAKLKLSDQDGRIEVEFEVDQNRVGVKWAVTIRQNAKVVRRVTKVTRAPSGSFEMRYVAANRAGTDKFAVTATRTGETCKAKASY